MIRQEVHDQAYSASRLFRKMRRGPDVTGLTEFTSAMTTLTDTALKDVMTVPQNLIGSWIRLMYVDDGSTAQERVCRITQFDPSAGTLTFSPAIGNVHGTAATVNGEYEIWPDTHPDFVDEAINQVLTSLRFLSCLPVSMVTDGTQEDSTTTHWAAIGTPTTREKTATSYPFQFGRLALHIVSDALDEGATSDNVAVANEENLTLGVALKLVSGTVDVILYDATNSTALKTVTVSDIEPVVVWFQQAPSSTTKNVTVRFESATAISEWYVGPVCLVSGQRSRYSLDTNAVVRPNDVLGLYSLPLGQSVETDVYLMGEPFQLVTRDTERDDRGNQINVVFTGDAPIFVEAYQRWTEFDADTDAHYLYDDKKTVAWGVLSKLEKARGNKAEAKEYLRDFNRMKGIKPIEFHEDIPDRATVRFQ